MEGSSGTAAGCPVPCTRILAAVDFSETSARGLELADRVVVASRGQGGITRMLPDSGAESVLRHTHCPVRVVR